MATLDTDFVRLNMSIGMANVPVRKLGMEWPPPERIYLAEQGEIREARDGDDPAFVMVRVRYSQLDDQVAASPHIARGAEYHYLRVVEAQ